MAGELRDPAQPILLPVKGEEYGRQTVKYRWGWDYRRLFRTRRDALLAQARGIA
jgi:hypothetical protein